MSLNIDDLISKKKEVVQILDLSKATANNAEEFKRVMEKVPDFKIKPEKIRLEDVKTQDRPRRWARRAKRVPYQFADPVPVEMRALKLDDLCSVPIQWNMLTTLRPKSKLDEEYFSRLVELGKLELVAFQKEKKVPLSDLLRRMKGRSGVAESRFVSCAECGEDFCTGQLCVLLQYEDFKRQPIPESLGKKEKEPRGRSKTKRRGKGKLPKGRSRGRSKTRSKSRGRSAAGDGRSKSRGRSAGGSGRSKSRGRSGCGERSASGGRSKSRRRSGSGGRSKSRGRSASGEKMAAKGRPKVVRSKSEARQRSCDQEQPTRTKSSSRKTKPKVRKGSPKKKP